MYQPSESDMPRLLAPGQFRWSRWCTSVAMADHGNSPSYLTSWSSEPRVLRGLHACWLLLLLAPVTVAAHTCRTRKHLRESSNRGFGNLTHQDEGASVLSSDTIGCAMHAPRVIPDHARLEHCVPLTQPSWTEDGQLRSRVDLPRINLHCFSAQQQSMCNPEGEYKAQQDGLRQPCPRLQCTKSRGKKSESCLSELTVILFGPF